MLYREIVYDGLVFLGSLYHCALLINISIQNKSNYIIMQTLSSTQRHLSVTLKNSRHRNIPLYSNQLSSFVAFTQEHAAIGAVPELLQCRVTVHIPHTAFPLLSYCNGLLQSNSPSMYGAKHRSGFFCGTTNTRSTGTLLLFSADR